jgi:hypothetical protein
MLNGGRDGNIVGSCRIIYASDIKYSTGTEIDVLA